MVYGASGCRLCQETIREDKGADKIEIHRNDFFDKRCLDVYEYVIKTGTAISERTGNWAQEFYSINDIFTFINTQFGDKNFVESILKQGK